MSTDVFHPIQPEFLLRLLLQDLPPHADVQERLFPELLYAFQPHKDDPFRISVHGVELETPLGAAAGPHTQLSWNIVAAWLAGARFIELKTVQKLDTLTVSKPCIDARDEGYNCEWSQELSLDQSYREYLHAWVIIHILQHALGHERGPESSPESGPGFLFNMSAGYDLAGIRDEKITRFLDRMGHAQDDIDALRQRLASIYPPVASAVTLPISPQISHNITISTMHGCPPEEIERMGRYFLEERGLHTTIKLNPTLLGADDARHILNAQLGWPVTIADDAFAHDLRYEQAVTLIQHLQNASAKAGRDFRVKLTNTLETVNTTKTLPDHEKCVYMSGRALHPLAVELARRLQMTFNGALNLSFSAGINIDNVAECLSCGLAPLTACTDLLKPGGYGRLHGMLEHLRKSMRPDGQSAILDVATGAKRIHRLTEYAARSADPDGHCAKQAHRSARDFPRPLPRYDCAAAPCQELCPSGLHQPEWLGFFALNQDHSARQAMRMTNPLLNTQAAFCDTMCHHKCERVCVRAALGSPVRIRTVRHWVEDEAAHTPNKVGAGFGSAPAVTACIYGDGAAGLVCAAWLHQAGLAVIVKSSSPEHMARRKLGPALTEGLARDKAVLAHHGVRFVEAGATHSAFSTLSFYSADAEVIAPEQFFVIGAHATTGPSSLRDAVQEGRESALVLLAQAGISLPSPAKRDPAHVLSSKMNVQAMPPTPDLAVLSDAEIQREAQRCLQCDLYCGLCASACPNHALAPLPSPTLAVPVLRLEPHPDGTHIHLERTILCRDPAQIVHLADLCNECGHCSLLCPSSGAPFRDKPHLHLSQASFNAAMTAGHYQLTGPHSLRSAFATLHREGDTLSYSSATVSALFSACTLEPLSANSTSPHAVLLEEAADMLLLYLLSEPLRNCL